MDYRTIGNLISGFGAKIVAAGIALSVAHSAFYYITDAFSKVNAAFPALN